MLFTGLPFNAMKTCRGEEHVRRTYSIMAGKTESRAGALAFPWWVVLIEGIFSLILGIFLITAPGMTTVFLVTVLGFYWLVRGIFSLVAIFIGETGMHWGWLLLSGILGIIAGPVVLRHPLLATVIVANMVVIIVAVLGLMMGLVDLAQAFSGSGWGIGMLGALSVIIAFMLLFNSFAAALFLLFVIAGFMIAGGIGAIFSSFRLRNV